jgi:dienelactone hydrolase
VGALSTQDPKAMIMIPDIWGWNSGRLRTIADLFSEKTNTLVVIPVLLVPPFEGGTDGDGLPPNFDMNTRGGDFVPWIKTITWEEIVKPRLRGIHSILLKKGGDSIKISLMGFCWGGWVVSKMLCEPELSRNITCGMIPHPSVFYFGRENSWWQYY